MESVAALLLGIALLATPFFGGGRDYLAQELWLSLAGLSALLCAAVFLSSRARSAWQPHWIVSASACGMVCGALIATFASDAPWLGAETLLFFLGGISLFFSAVWLARDTLLFCIATGLVGVTALLVFSGLWNFMLGTTTFLAAPFYAPGPLAAWLLLVIPVILAWYARETILRRKILWGLLSIACITALILTGVRGGYFTALVIACPFLWFLSRSCGARRGIWEPVALGAAALALAFALSFFHTSSLRNEIPSFSVLRPATPAIIDYSTAHRILFWKGSVALFLERPAFGWGPGTFASLWPPLQNDPTAFARWPHSIFFELITESGIVGIAPFLIFLGWIFFEIMRCTLRRRARTLHGVTWGAMGYGLIGLTLHGFGDIDFHYPAIFGAFWIVSGMIIATKPRVASVTEPNVLQTQPHALRFRRIASCAMLGCAGIAVFTGAMFFARAELLRHHIPSFLRTGHYVAAATLAERAGMFSRNPLDLLDAGEFLLGSMPIAASAISETPYSYRPHAIAAMTHIVNRIVADARRARDIDPHDADSFALEARSQLLMGKFEQAQLLFEEALVRDPYNHPEYALWLSSALLSQQRIQEAGRALDEMLFRYDERTLLILSSHAEDYFARGGIRGGPGETLRWLSRVAERKSYIRALQQDAIGANKNESGFDRSAMLGIY